MKELGNGHKHHAKKEIISMIVGHVKEAAEDWVKKSDMRRSLILTFYRNKTGVAVTEIKYVCASLTEIEERGLMEEFRNGHVIITSCY